MERQIDKQMSSQMDKQIYRQMTCQMDGLIERQIDRLMDRYIDRWIDCVEVLWSKVDLCQGLNQHQGLNLFEVCFCRGKICVEVWIDVKV